MARNRSRTLAPGAIAAHMRKVIVPA